MSDVSTPCNRRYLGMPDVLVHGATSQAIPPEVKGLTLPEPVFPRFPEALRDPGTGNAPQKRSWSGQQIYRKIRG